MEIWVDENIPQGPEAFADHGEVVRFAGRGLKRADIASADALIVRSVTRVDAALLDGTAVRFVGTATIGTDHVDQEYLKARGIGFASAPGCNANSVGDYVCAALTHLEQARGFSLEGKTLGIIGYGHVGKRVAAKAPALGLRVLRNDPPLRDAALTAGLRSEAESFCDLETVLAESDIVSLHVPLVIDGPHPTLRLAGEDFFRRLAKPIVLMNTCRGEVIHEPDLRAALDAGKVRHLVLDVFTGEPRIDAGICARADLISPHIAGYSLQGKLNGTAQIAEAFRRHFGFATRWDPIYPAPAQPEIDYSATTAQRFLYHCIHHAYPILSDDGRLRQALLEADPGKAFDRLRRDYPVRHEFASYRIKNLPFENREMRSRLAGLGFRLD